ncbi:MAG TPA: hypothetical protein VKG45_01440 [Actinomycetes bacterium]|nr:hypothetical protein [Actinomycetes bacterium]
MAETATRAASADAGGRRAALLSCGGSVLTGDPGRPRTPPTRALAAEGEASGGWRGHERLLPPAALNAYSAGVAFQAGDTTTGTIAVGRRTDPCPPGADPARVPPGEPAGVPVPGTWLEGLEVSGA